MAYTLTQAARATGKSKSTLRRAIQRHEISATRDQLTRGWLIEAAELYQVYPPTQPFDRPFEPVAREIGFLLRDWNYLQESLADLFVILVASHDEGSVRAKWYAANDRHQRKMLREAATEVFGPLSSATREPQAKDNAFILREINWIIRKSKDLGAQRATTAHAPLAPLLDPPYGFIAHHLSGNPFAKNLQGKQPLREFKLYRTRALFLHDYTHDIVEWLRDGRSWRFPKRPDWITPGH